MKKQLLAVAVASAFASTAFAANVTVYGTVDTGLVYTHQSFGGALPTNGDSSKFSMDSGVLGASEFGFKGTEDLGDGYSVSFQLENGFKSDTGALSGADDNKLFDREARLSLNTPYGTVSFGRMGALTSGAGTYDVFQATGDALDGGNANYIGTGYWFSRGRCDNMITLVTPEANGFTGYAQYSFQTSGSEKTSVRENDRYMALGLTYSAGPLNVAVVADMVEYSNSTVKELNYANEAAAGADGYKKYDDAKAISLGVNYDFGVTQAFFGAQYGKNEKLSISSFGLKTEVLTDANDKPYDIENIVVDGYNLHIGAATPLPCGTLTVSAYYGDYEMSDDSDVTAKKYGFGAMHTYPISKRTTFYTGAGYGQTDVKSEDKAVRIKGFDVTMGLTHKF